MVQSAINVSLNRSSTNPVSCARDRSNGSWERASCFPIRFSSLPSLSLNTVSQSCPSLFESVLKTSVITAVSVGYGSGTGAMFGAIYNLASGAGRVGFGVLADLVVGVSITGQTTPSPRS